jgi:hypothetical protein
MTPVVAQSPDDRDDCTTEPVIDPPLDDVVCGAGVWLLVKPPDPDVGFETVDEPPGTLVPEPPAPAPGVASTRKNWLPD